MCSFSITAFQPYFLPFRQLIDAAGYHYVAIGKTAGNNYVTALIAWATLLVFPSPRPSSVEEPAPAPQVELPSLNR